MHLPQEGTSGERFARLGRTPEREEAASRLLWAAHQCFLQQRVGTAYSQPPGQRNSFEAFDVLQGPSRRILWEHASPPFLSARSNRCLPVISSRPALSS